MFDRATALLVKDDQDIARLIGFHLKKAGFATRWRLRQREPTVEIGNVPSRTELDAYVTFAKRILNIVSAAPYVNVDTDKYTRLARFLG
jgi:hypothetical protein